MTGFVLHFGNEFDGPVFSKQTGLRTGELYAGAKKLLSWLENQLGLSGYPDNTDYLRIELYRQALGQHLMETSAQAHFAATPFYEKSFAADRFATAAALLAWRDELLLSGKDTATFFEKAAHLNDLPPRLATFAAAS